MEAARLEDAEELVVHLHYDQKACAPSAGDGNKDVTCAMLLSAVSPGR